MPAICLSRKRMKVRVVLVLLAGACGLAAGNAQDGAALYRSKCLVCHGTRGEGKAALPGTNLLTDTARKATDLEMAESIAQGGTKKLASHAFQNKGVKPPDIQALVKYIRTLQSKQKS
jgi:mono/diheme cytochrome c family protein